VLGIIY